MRALPALALLMLIAGCGHSGGDSRAHLAPAASDVGIPSGGEDKSVNVYNWFDYISPAVLRKFTAATGIKVNYSVFDSNNTLTAKLLAGHSDYDVVFPSGATLETLVAAGVFRTLDRSRLPNLHFMDPAISERLAAHDPGNTHAVVYTWGITGIAYNEAKVRARMPDAPLDSWSLMFDPAVAAHFTDCGIGLYESPNIIVPSVLAWLGEPANSEDPVKLQRAQNALMAARPNIRKISSGSLVDDLANGDLCIIIASNGDAMQARERVRIAANGANAATIGFSIPREGAVLWFDVAAIPADAPHPRNAHRLIDFLLDPAIAAENTNLIRFPNGNAQSQSAVEEQLRNATIYPSGELAARLIPERAKSEDYVRLRTRVWTKFRTGR